MPVVEAPDGVVRRRTVQRGGFLFVEGDDSTSVVVFAEGRLKLVVTSPDGEHLLLGVLDPPTVLGEIGLIDGGPRSANAEILEDATVLIVPAEEIWRLLRADSAFVEASLAYLTGRTRTLTKTTADLVFLVPGRLARLWAETAASELGQRVGASRQSVNGYVADVRPTQLGGTLPPAGHRGRFRGDRTRCRRALSSPCVARRDRSAGITELAEAARTGR